MGRFIEDIRHGLRSLLRSPVFAAVAVLTLGVGVGANTAIFSVMDAVLFRPLPYADGHELVWLSNRYLPGGETGAVSAPEYWEFRETADAFESMAAMRGAATNLTGLEVPVRIQGAAVTPAFFELLGASPVLGRAFSDDEAAPGAAPVVVISHGLWQRALGGDPAVLGTDILMGGTPRTIVGIMSVDHTPLPELLFSGQTADYWLPLSISPEEFTLARAEMHNLRVVGRLTDGVEPSTAEQALIPAVRRIEARFPGISNEGERDVQVEPLREYIVGDVGSTLWLLFATVGLVLLVACVNLTNLMLARGESRQPDVAVRSALGASRGALVSHVTVESLLVGMAGGVVGIGLAFLAQRQLLELAPAGLPRLEEVGVNWTVLLFSLALSVLAAVVAGLLPTVRLLRWSRLDALRAAGRSGSVGSSGGALRRALVIAEVSAAVVIVAAAGLMGRTILELRSVDPGFSPADLHMVQINATRSGYGDLESVRQLYASLQSGLEAHGAIQSVSASWQTPFQSGMSDWPVMTEAEGAEWRGADPNWVSNSYFDTHGIRLVEGRLFSPGDLDRPEGTVIVSESAARRLWPEESAIGKRVNINFDQLLWREVVGVVADVKVRGLRSERLTQTYLPFSDVPFGPIPTLTLTAQTTLGTEALRQEVVSVLRSIDGDIPVGTVESMTDQLNRSLSRERFISVLMTAFGSVALFLGAIGVYGLLTHVVSRRKREIGLRIALGARPAKVLRGVVNDALILGGAGVVLGLAASVASTRFLERYLFGVSAWDTSTLAAVSLVVLCATALASYFPARWAASVDPMTALREE